MTFRERFFLMTSATGSNCSLKLFFLELRRLGLHVKKLPVDQIVQDVLPSLGRVHTLSLFRVERLQNAVDIRRLDLPAVDNRQHSVRILRRRRGLRRKNERLLRRARSGLSGRRGKGGRERKQENACGKRCGTHRLFHFFSISSQKIRYRKTSEV